MIVDGNWGSCEVINGAGYAGQRGDSRAGRDQARQPEISPSNQNDTQFKTYELFASGIVHLIFSDPGWLQVPEPTESKTSDKARLLYLVILL